MSSSRKQLEQALADLEHETGNNRYEAMRSYLRLVSLCNICFPVWWHGGLMFAGLAVTCCDAAGARAEGSRLRECDNTGGGAAQETPSPTRR